MLCGSSGGDVSCRQVRDPRGLSTPRHPNCKRGIHPPAGPKDSPYLQRSTLAASGPGLPSVSVCCCLLFVCLLLVCVSLLLVCEGFVVLLFVELLLWRNFVGASKADPQVSAALSALVLRLPLQRRCR